MNLFHFDRGRHDSTMGDSTLLNGMHWPGVPPELELLFG